ncbi:calcineurin-like phosphoesterase family protein [Herbihabitans rhizosphaerae]|uniref:Calcineurin-like phosphoesterase family protein n=1 Tax=Herbihabitans rhizosphaerae TaxID=1872711 RepID=A0A4Q7KGH4_9PSEU|nr:metallophosphoesterase [Herbihabitans rhizosphaerae]RZS34352.1 calcineurin-like phosphoesterase family protein [Herbihabitans rhizosphaerae]
MEHTSPRPRPREITEAELGFKPQPPVAWLAPSVLAATGVKSLVATVFGSYSDKRELQGSLPANVHRFEEGDELWLDFVADLGDGFDATYSIASLLAAESITLPGELSLPRGRLLVMGGDQVYPSASTETYEDRSKGVYRAALPTAEAPRPRLFALPGNHDWYDGLTAFLRVFGQQRTIGGWQTEQSRSYFAIELPHRWWLYAIDTQFDDYVDAPQLEYFRTAAEDLREGDGVILCTPAPSWVVAGSGGEAKGYDTIEFFEREILRPHGANIRMMLSGDQHHYARYAEEGGGEVQRITCGTGGAYLAATHQLPEKLTLPPPTSRIFWSGERRTSRLAGRYPSTVDSKRLSLGIIRLPWRNRGFATLMAGVHFVLFLAFALGLVITSGRERASAITEVPAWTPAVLCSVLLIVGTVNFARLGLPDRRARAGLVAGVLHGLAHLGIAFGWLFVVQWLYLDVLGRGVGSDWLVIVIAVVVTPALLGFVGSELTALYLLLAGRFGINLNEVFAGQSISDRKGFLRMRVGADGDLTIYPIKVHTVAREWVPDPDGAPSDPWLRPATPLAPELIEEPIRVTRLPNA